MTWTLPDKKKWNATPRDEWAMELAVKLEVGETDLTWDGDALVVGFKDYDGKVTIFDATIRRIWV